ncbi:MAG: F0F1 ATP synthase subunit epsilon [Planctomycetes bacterium]|nr:F0F1 ATP synthase subunit epsilon [Planctomycetota bacterium]
MAGSLTLRVITPARIAFDQTVESVRVPGADGDLGILPRHANMVAALDTGLMRYRVGGKEQVLYVSGGFCEVRDSTVRVVTEAGERPDEIDEERARSAERRARERLSQGRVQEGEPLDILRAEASLRRALMRLRAREFRSE